MEFESSSVRIIVEDSDNEEEVQCTENKSPNNDITEVLVIPGSDESEEEEGSISGEGKPSVYQISSSIDMDTKGNSNSKIPLSLRTPTREQDQFNDRAHVHANGNLLATSTPYLSSYRNRKQMLPLMPNLDITAIPNERNAMHNVSLSEEEDEDDDLRFLGARSKVKKEISTIILEDDEVLEGDITKRLNQLQLDRFKQQKEKKIQIINPISTIPPPTLPFQSQKDEFRIFRQLASADLKDCLRALETAIDTYPSKDLSDNKVEDLKVPLYDHQVFGLVWLKWREEQFPCGGILADEMGLGKTVEILSLILSTKKDTEGSKEKNKWVNTEQYGNLVPSQATLVICPVSVLKQWEEEIRTKSRGLSVLSYYDSPRTKHASVLAQHDVVITTYTVVGNEIPKERRFDRITSPILRIFWKRVVLDEGHTIRNPSTNAFNAVSQLKARFRWVLTGTPVHNKPADMFSLCSFLRLKPFDDKKTWDDWIGLKGLKGNESRALLEVLGKALLLRRTKDEVKTDGGNVGQLMEKTVENVEVELNEDELKVYNHLKGFVKERFNKFISEQKDHQLQQAAEKFVHGGGRRKKDPKGGDEQISYTHIFTLLLRLRQASVLPFLISQMIEEEDSDADQSFDPDENIIDKRNPVFEEEYLSSKLTRLFQDIDKIKRDSRNEGKQMDKIVVVSQWTKLLNIVYRHLRYKGYSVASITGEVNAMDRQEIMTRLNSSSSKPNILLLSLQAGGVGLNLVGANRMFILDPHWNPQLENQVYDRIHRFGQTKDVKIIRYLTTGTIEERVAQLQDEKLALANQLLNAGKSKTAGTGLTIKDMLKLLA